MKPEWFCCEKCLWWDNRENYLGYCKHSSTISYEGKIHGINYFCDHWTCANCWQEWDDTHWTSETPEEHEDGHWEFTDHSKCQTVRFAK